MGSLSGALVAGSVGLGAYSLWQQNKAFNEAGMDAKQAKALAAQQLEFDKQKYKDWENTFGPLGENLHDYYLHLQPDQYEARIASSIMGNVNGEHSDIAKAMALRGIEGSGLNQYANMETNQAAISRLSQAPIQAMDLVHQQQQQFANMGLGNNVGLANQLGGATTNAINGLNYSEGQNLQNAVIAGQSANSSFGAAGYMLGRNGGNK